MKIMKVLIALIAMVLLSSVAFAANSSNGLDVDFIKVDGDRVEDGDNIRVDLGERIDIRVKLQANEDIEDLEVSARISGYEYNDVQTLFDVTRPFDLEQDDTETVDLELSIPIRAEKDEYELRIDIQDRTTRFVADSFTVRVKGPRSAVRIKDVIFSPRNEVMAGRALLSQVRLENIGERDLDDVLVIVDIPQLGVSGEVFLDEELDGSKAGDGDSEVSEEVFIRIPECADAGVYDVYVAVEFDEFEVIETVESIRVVTGDSCSRNNDNQNNQQQEQPRTLITAPAAQNVATGASGVSYPLIITNTGSSAKAYNLRVNGVESWGSAELTDAAPIVGAGQSKTVYVYVAANEDATVGQQIFTVTISDGNQVIEVPVTATVVEGESKEDLSGVRRGLEIGLIVLIVLLVILGLIIGLGKLKDNDDEDDGRSQAYY